MKPLDAKVVTFKENKTLIRPIKVSNIDDIAEIYKKNCIYNRNIFVYSGHSDGLFLIHKKIHLFSLKNFMEIIRKSISKKADIVFGDACLLGKV